MGSSRRTPRSSCRRSRSARASIPLGSSTTLAWSTLDASSCTASATPATTAWTGAQTASGSSLSVTPAAAGAHGLHAHVHRSRRHVRRQLGDPLRHLGHAAGRAHAHARIDLGRRWANRPPSAGARRPPRAARRRAAGAGRLPRRAARRSHPRPSGPRRSRSICTNLGGPSAAGVGVFERDRGRGEASRAEPRSGGDQHSPQTRPRRSPGAQPAPPAAPHRGTQTPLRPAGQVFRLRAPPSPSRRTFWARSSTACTARMQRATRRRRA